MRRHLWTNHLVNTPPPPDTPEVVDSPASFLASLVDAAYYAA